MSKEPEPGTGPRPSAFDVPYGISGEYWQDFSCNKVTKRAIFYRRKLNSCNGFYEKDLDPNSMWNQTTYPRTQGGRFPRDPSKDTKSRPVISRGFEPGSLGETSKDPEERTWEKTKKLRQSGNIFPNTYNMTKAERHSYMIRNKSALRR
jgi:hypothetical protein